MRNKLATWIRDAYSELTRTGWALAFAALGFAYLAKSGRELFVQQIGVLVWKLTLVGVGVFTAHKARKQLFPYVDVSQHIANGDAVGGQVFLGVCILAAAIIHALCAGL
jgi:hypothetical protein